MKNKKYKLIVCVLGFLCIVSLTASAQLSPQQAMAQVYEKYDNVNYLSFDVKYRYSSDTVAGDFQHEVLSGSYTMAGKKAKYHIGDVEFLQNDSFFIAVYNKDQFMIVSNPRNDNAGRQLPLRGVIDSLFMAYSKNYLISHSIDAGEGLVKFTGADSAAQFKHFFIRFDTASHLLNSVQYDFEEIEIVNPDDSTGPPRPVTRNKSLRIEFSNYGLNNFSPELYSENNYIWYEDGVCRPVDKYRDFKIYDSHTRKIRSNGP